MRPLDFLGRIKVKLGLVIVLAVATAFVVNEVGINSGLSREVRIAVAVALALIMVQLLAAGMTKPLREMARAAQTIAKGRYTLRVRATSRDEVGELARAFNAMADDLGAVDRQRRELVANVSHELRTPITGLRAVLENVVDGVSAPDPATMRTALAQTERLGRLVAQLLDLSRLDSGARLIEPEPVELAPLVEQAVAEASLAREDVRLLPRTTGGLGVRADPDLLAQVLANLLDNAVRHSPAGGTVTVTATGEGAGIRLVVADLGPGIPEAARGRVFERFSRLDAGRAADAGGAGLGLAIVKEIVELHGGSIRIDDCAGCRMIIDLPGRTTMADAPREPELATGEQTTVRDEAPVPTPQTAPQTAPQTMAQPEDGRDPVEGDLAGAVPGRTERAGSVEVEGGSVAVEGRPVAAMGWPVDAEGRLVVAGSRSGEGESRSLAADGEPVAVGGRSGESGGRSVVTGGAPAEGEGSSAEGSRGRGEDGAPATAGAAVARQDAPAVPAQDPAADPRALRPGVPAQVRGAGESSRERLAKMAVGVVVGVMVGFLIGMFAAVFASLMLGDSFAFVTLVLCTATFGAIGASLGAGSGRRGAYAAATAPRTPPASSTPESATASSAASASSASSALSASSASSPYQRQEPLAGQPHGAQPPPPAYVPPPLFPRPELPETPRWLLPAAAGAGVFAAVALPDAQVGLGIVLVSMVLGAAALPAVLRRMTPWTVAYGLVAYVLIAMAAIRDADWLVTFLLLAGAALVALAVSGAGRGWLGVIRGGASVLLALGPVPWFLARPLKNLRAKGGIVSTLAALGITAVLLVVFGLLFASADAVFASYVERLTTTPAWAESLPLRIFVFVVFAALLAAVVLVALRPVVDPVAPEIKVGVRRTVWLLPLTAVNLLFAVFVMVQLTVLFGGDALVLKTAGLTYAEYARQGFFQLVAVSVIVLGIVAVAASVLKTERRERWLLSGLLGVLCGLTLVVLFSALHRLGLYTDAYGLSRLRLSVQATIWWLFALFALVLIAGGVRLAGRGAGWLPRTIVLVTALGLAAFAVVNPDLRVAESQVEARGGQTFDTDYLGDLGAEAVPALDRLPEPLRSCVLSDVAAANDLGGPDPWNGWNLARAEARALLAERPILPARSCAARSGD
ncbi:DUF4153 domain-containing protein [Nonomuraea sp. ZG12]|uniref:DUF4153 domain-containing protein n=1 Tax=Nonomuraea sp. ZG12 TaxID=3452207 RepID=UPI003F89208C